MADKMITMTIVEPINMAPFPLDEDGEFELWGDIGTELDIPDYLLEDVLATGSVLPKDIADGGELEARRELREGPVAGRRPAFEKRQKKAARDIRKGRKAARAERKKSNASRNQRTRKNKDK